jgi:hypothetical protein
MADAARIAALRASLLRELEIACPFVSTPSRARLRWLRNELENYLDRWLAFAAVESIPLKSLLADDLFAMVLVATDVCEQEFARASARPEKEAWDAFTGQLARIGKTKDRAILPNLRPALDRVGADLA